MKTYQKILLSLGAVLALSEGILRVKELSVPDEKRYPSESLEMFWQNVMTQMNNPDRIFFFHAPFTTFENSDPENKARLKLIFDHTKGPVGTTVVTRNNLSDSREEFRYTLNREGFRGPDREISKAKGSHRILALGTYQTWGFGVNDSETYSHYLEEEFRNLNPGLKVEVWNGGRISSKAITGLAHLIHNGLRINPDLVILDFGFADSLKVRRDISLKVSPFELKLKKLRRYSYLIRGIEGLLYPRPKLEDPLEEFRVVMNEMISILKERKINFVILEQQFFFTEMVRPWFQEAGKNKLPVVKVADVFRESPPTEEEWKETLWTRDIPEKHRKSIAFFEGAPYRIDPFHVNAKGNKLVAKALRKKILELKLLDGR